MVKINTYKKLQKLHGNAFVTAHIYINCSGFMIAAQWLYDSGTILH